MTKPRVPHTYAEAMTRIAGVVTFKRCARIVRRSDRLVRKWSEDGNVATPTLAQAEALDLAYIAAGGDGAPFADTLRHRLGLAVDDALASQRELAASIARAAKETGEAFAFAIPITQSNASPRDIHRACAEVEEARLSLRALGRSLARFLPLGIGSTGNTGGAHD